MTYSVIVYNNSIFTLILNIEVIAKYDTNGHISDVVLNYTRIKFSSQKNTIAKFLCEQFRLEVGVYIINIVNDKFNKL